MRKREFVWHATRPLRENVELLREQLLKAAEDRPGIAFSAVDMAMALRCFLEEDVAAGATASSSSQSSEEGS